MSTKRKASAMANAVNDEPVDPSDELKFICLGGGNEVGRSCHIIQYKGKTVMVCPNTPLVLQKPRVYLLTVHSLTPGNTPHTTD
ncbi:unnamed protein product [Discula destructiva]